MTDLTRAKSGRLVQAFPTIPPGDKAFGLDPDLAPLWAAYNAALRMGEQLKAHATAVNGDKRYSDLGKRDAIRAWAVENAMPVLRDLLQSVATADQRQTEIRAAIHGDLIDKTDIAGALVRAETRTWLRSLEPAKRGAMLSGPEPVDPMIALAVIEAPAALSGVHPRQHERLASAAAAARHPQQAAKLDELAEAVEATASAWKLAAGEIESVAGVPVLREVEEAAGARTGRGELLARIREAFGSAAEETA